MKRSPRAYPPFLFQSGVHRAHRQSALFVEAQCRELGLTGPEAHLLGYIQSRQPCPLGELGRVFGHKPSTLTSLLDRFEDRGLVRRVLSREDRRAFVLELTAHGERVATRARAIAMALESAVARQVSDADRRAFERVLAAFAAATGVAVRPTQPERSPTPKRPPGGRSATSPRPKRRKPS